MTTTPPALDLAALRGILASYDAAAEKWQQANAEQDDAPSVKDAERYSEALENVAHAFVAQLRDAIETGGEWGWQGDPRVDLDVDDPRHRDTARPAPEGLAVFAHWSASHDGINVEVDLPDGLGLTVHVNDGKVFQWQPGDPCGCQADPAVSYVLHYTSADAPGDDATWSVYRERYPSRDHDEPIDGSQERVSTHPTEAEANAEARRLQASANA